MNMCSSALKNCTMPKFKFFPTGFVLVISIPKKGRLNMKLKELRLLNIKIMQDEQIIFEGRTEDIPENLKNREYKKIYFEGTSVVAVL